MAESVKRPSPLRAIVIGGLLGILAIGGAIAFDRSGGTTPQAGKAEIAAFAAAPTASSVPSAEEKQRFVTVFSRGPSLIATLDLAHLRRFSLGGAGVFTVVAAPRKKGGLCYLDSASGGVCIDTFAKGIDCAGMTEGYRKVRGAKHNVITGLVPDGFVSIAFRSGAATAATQVHDNVFQFVVPPSLYGGIDSCTLTRADGSTHSDPISI
jgi:hypothetical protein